MARRIFGAWRLTCAFLFLATALLAHHSFGAEYDATKPVTLTGVITKIDWTNPHSYFFIDVKDDKGKICAGHLKRWFYVTDRIEQACGDVKAAYGPQAEIYRCEHCKTLYLPNPEEEPRTGTLSF